MSIKGYISSGASGLCAVLLVAMPSPPAGAYGACYNSNTSSFGGPTAESQAIYCQATSGDADHATVSDGGYNGTDFLFFYGDGTSTAWNAVNGASVLLLSGEESGVNVGVTPFGGPATTVSAANADALVLTGLKNFVGVHYGSTLSATGGNAVSIVDGTITIFVNSATFQSYLDRGGPVSLEEGWGLFLEGMPSGAQYGTVIGDVTFNGGIGFFNNFGMMNGAVKAASGGNYQIANIGTLTGGVDVTASGGADVRYASLFNNGNISSGVKLSGPNAFLYNLSTGSELADLLALVVPDAVDEAANDTAEIAVRTHDALIAGAPAGAHVGEITGGVTLTGDTNRLMNLGTISGGASLTAGLTAQVAAWTDGGLRGFNQVWNALGGVIDGGLTLNGGSTLLQNDILFRSSIVNLGEINGAVNINGASTSVLNGAVIPELTDGFFSAAGAPAEEEIALLRADVPSGVDRGVINGDMTFGDAGHSFLNLGLVDGTITFGAGDDVFSNVGEVTGNVDLGDGNDTAFVGASAIFGGTLSGGAGTSNALTFFGTGTFDPAKFLNFQTIVFDVQTGQSATLTPTGAIESDFTVAPGVTLDLTQGGTLASNEDDRDIDISGSIEGDVDLGAGSNTTFTLNQGGSVTGSINGGTSGTSTLNLNLDGTLGNDISSFQTVTVTTTDTATPLKLTGNVVVLDTLSLAGGALRLNGSLTVPNVNVAAGSVLGGGGTVTGSIQSTGTVAPGNSIGTLSIVGNYTESGTLEIETSPQKSIDTFRADRLDVTGNITLNSGSRLFVTAETLSSVKEVTTADDWPGSATVSIIDFAGTRTGTFTTVTDDFVFLTPTVDYDDGNGQVLLTLAITPVDLSIARNDNELSMLDALNRNLGTLGKLRGVNTNEVATLTGEVGTSGATLAGDLTGQFLAFQGQPGGAPDSYVISGTVEREAIKVASLDDTIGVSGKKTASGAHIWVAPWGSTANHRGSNGASGYSADAYGLAAGYVVNPSDKLELGLSAGYGHTNADGFVANDNIDVDSVHLGAHVAQHDGALTTQASLAYGYHMFDQSRVAVVGGVPELLTADYAANELVGQVRVSYEIVQGALLLRPYVGADYSLLFRESFAEQGSMLGADLAFDSETFHHGNLFYGMDMTSAMSLSEGVFKPYAGIGANYAYGDLDGQSSVRFAGTSTNFTIAGAEQDRWQLLTRAGFALRLASSLDLVVGYNGAFGRNETNHTAQASLNYSF